MATVFQCFKSVPYEYLQIARSNIAGNVIVSTRSLTGVFKEKGGMIQSGDLELAEASSALYVRPADFTDVENCQEFVGSGIRLNGQTYNIEGASTGTNFATGVIEHYTLTLQPMDFNELPTEGEANNG